MNKSAARSHARALLVQAHYQHQVTGTSHSDLLAQFMERQEHERVDPLYFAELLKSSVGSAGALDEEIVALAERPLDELNPVEIGILRVALTELRERIDIPFRVVIDEAIKTARRFGAEDGHKFVNAVLDRAAREHRAVEWQARA